MRAPGCQPVVWEVGPSPDPVEEPAWFEEGDRKEQHIPTALLEMLHSEQLADSLALQLAPISNLLTKKTLAVCRNKSLAVRVQGCRN